MTTIAIAIIVISKVVQIRIGIERIKIHIHHHLRLWQRHGRLLHQRSAQTTRGIKRMVSMRGRSIVLMLLIMIYACLRLKRVWWWRRRRAIGHTLLHFKRLTVDVNAVEEFDGVVARLHILVGDQTEDVAFFVRLADHIVDGTGLI